MLFSILADSNSDFTVPNINHMYSKKSMKTCSYGQHE